MTTGLKQMVEAAMNDAPEIPPVEVSGEAVLALSQKMREWSGWSDATLVFGDPTKDGSPFAVCDHDTRVFTASADRLILNPHRVLVTVTPFRLKQEAVLTGCLLHEAGHARHSHWLPRNKAEAESRPLVHSDGSPVTKQAVALARLMEEPRIEGLQYRDADDIGAVGLGWTMRASAAHLLPGTALAADPNQKIMDLITSWALRAGRQIALHHWTNGQHRLRSWVQDFTTLVHSAIEAHLLSIVEDYETGDTRRIMDLLLEMIRCEDDRGPTMLDKARDVLALLFPETPPEDQPEAGTGCQSDQSEESEGEPGENQPEDGSDQSGDETGDEEGEQGEGDTKPEDEGSGTDEGEGDTGDEDDDEEGASPSTDEPEQDEPETEPEQDDSGSGEPEVDTESDLAQQLADMEAHAKSETEEEVEEEEAEGTETSGGIGTGGESVDGEGWRSPTPDERDIQKGAERFLRMLVEPSESSKVTLTDTPSSTVDGAALSAWKAGGQVNAPHFFRRTRREVEPSPPVKVAILVDVSGSMEELQKPSAILSWALASAALDLRNFAGRGQQIESCLIHWGSTARTIQRNGQMLPGIREVPCLEGTSAMHYALDLVEEELPGFFDITDRPVNRLLVQFTDWELGYWRQAAERIEKALAAGVNMVSVVPHDYSPSRSTLDMILQMCKIQRGQSTLMRYNKMFPEQVWETAAKSLR